MRNNQSNENNQSGRGGRGSPKSPNGQGNPGDVQFVRWPAESARRKLCERQGLLRLLIIEGGAPAPVCRDVREDWVRIPISREDLRARVAALRARSQPYTKPRMDASGTLNYRGRLVSVSPVEAALLTMLTTRFCSLATREELVERLAGQRACSSRNALDLHIMRIRRRIKPLGLVIRTAWSRGYILEPATAASDAAGSADGLIASAHQQGACLRTCLLASRDRGPGVDRGAPAA